jgi:arylsulfatase
VEPGSGYYATTAIGDHAVRSLKEHAEKFGDRPFFHYLAFTAPHFPLHALPEDIARYRERYGRGWDEVRAERWRRQKELGIARGEMSKVERDVGPPYHFPKALEKLGPGEVNRPLPWGELTAEQRELQATKMAIHAAMVDRMDREIGRVVGELRDMGVFDDTLIFFLSDNGASAEIMVRDDGHDPRAEPGSARSHLSLGPGWSTAANTPFRRHKTWVHEGGISTPLIAHWPRGIPFRGALRHTPGHVIDIAPTILEVAGAEPLTTWEGRPVPPAPGRSFAPLLRDPEPLDPRAPRSLWWLHEGNRALRLGDWKLVAAGEGAPWELYDLSRDRAEMEDLARAQPDKVRELEAEWTRQRDAFARIAAEDLGAR